MKKIFKVTSDVSEAEKLVNELKKLALEVRDDQVEKSELIESLKEIICFQSSEGYWKFINLEKIPFEGKVYLYKQPTIYIVSIMMRVFVENPSIEKLIPGFEKSLHEALNILQKGKLVGHGFSGFEFYLESIDFMLDFKMYEFISEYPEFCFDFTEFIMEQKKCLTESIENGSTKFDYDEEFKLRIKKVLGKMNGQDEEYIFVYGTLMHKNPTSINFLSPEKYVGEATLSGYSLYDLGSFPGIVKDLDGKVKGEVFLINTKQLNRIDSYEGDIYERKQVSVLIENESVKAWVFTYVNSVNKKDKISFEFQPWYYGIKFEITQKVEDKELIWYACYGSNINKVRFMKYIKRCSDKTPPIEEKKYMFSHPIYFAAKSSNWNNKGFAFLDTESNGLTFGKAYKITRNQFGEILEMEGRCYNKNIELGYMDKIPVKTFTAKQKRTDINLPDRSYLDVIKSGILDLYDDMQEDEVETYLIKSCLEDFDKSILEFIIKQPHKVNISKIVSGFILNRDKVVVSIKKLLELGLIRQDKINKSRGISWNDYLAEYYTVVEKRNIIRKSI